MYLWAVDFSWSIMMGDYRVVIYVERHFALATHNKWVCHEPREPTNQHAVLYLQLCPNERVKLLKLLYLFCFNLFLTPSVEKLPLALHF